MDVASHKQTSDEKYVGILFADIRGYSSLNNTETNLFHQTYLPNLWDNIVKESTLSLFGAKTWGDGITCVCEDLNQLAVFALCLSEQFDGQEWKGNIHKPLRLRIALHTGYVYPTPEPYSKSIEQFTGTDMVKPARLEPIVRPGQVWCTSDFREAILRSNTTDSLQFIFDNLREVEFAKDYGAHTVYRIRHPRLQEEAICKFETEMRIAQKLPDRDRFLANLEKLLDSTEDEFLFLSEYLSWYEVGEAMIDLKLFRQAEDLILKLKAYVSQKGWMSEEIKVYLNCLLANCASNISDTETKDFERALRYIEDISGDKYSRTEIDILIAQTYKKMSMACIDIDDFSTEMVRNLLIKSERHFRKVFNERTFDGPRLFPELNLLPDYKYFNHQAAINIAEIAAFLTCLSNDSSEKKSFNDKKETFSELLIHWYRASPPDSDSESEILAFVIAYVLLEKGEEACKVIEGKARPSNLGQRIRTIANFPRMRDVITEAAVRVLKALGEEE